MADLETPDIDTGAIAPANIPGPEHTDTDGGLVEKPQRLSVRDSIKASIKEVEAKELPSKDGNGTGPAKEAALTPETGGERLRGPDGKFLPSDAAPDKAAAKPEIPKTGTDQAPLQASQPSDGMPAAWSKDKAPLWGALPKEAQAFIAQRENQISEGFKQYGEIKRRHDEIEQVMAPARSFLQSKGVQSDAQAIQTLLQWSVAIDRNPQQAIQQLAAQYGVNLSTARGTDQPQADGTQPEIPSQLRPVLDQFGNQISSVSQELAALKAQEEQRQRENSAQQIQQFAQTKNPDGSLKYPHFDKLREAMGRLMQSGMVADLDSAYDRALWSADPEFRQQMIQAEIAKADEARKKQQAEAVAKAKAANVSVRSSAPGASVANGSNKPKKGLSVRESILQAKSEVEERARA